MRSSMVLPQAAGKKKRWWRITIAPPPVSFEKDEILAGSARRARSSGASGGSRARRHRQKTFALRALAGQLAGTANGFGLFAGALLGRLLIVSAHLHFAEDAFALHLFLERAKRLVNIVVADEYLHGQSCLSV
jgi:hypothetical protein